MKKDSPVYAYIRKGMTLVPELEMDLEALDGVPENGRVIIDIKHGRSLPRLRAYWAVLGECLKATDCTSNTKTLHNLVKLHTDLVEYVKLPSGLLITLPSSIAFEKLNEADFIKHFERAQEWLAREYGFVSERKVA